MKQQIEAQTQKRARECDQRHCVTIHPGLECVHQSDGRCIYFCPRCLPQDNERYMDDRTFKRRQKDFRDLHPSPTYGAKTHLSELQKEHIMKYIFRQGSFTDRNSHNPYL